MKYTRSPRYWMDGKSPAARASVIAGLALFLTGCGQSDTPEAEQVRPVKAVTAQTRAVSESVSLSGQIRAEEEINLAFRMDGQLVERRANVGNWVETGEVVARLDPKIAMNTERTAEADLSAARSALTQADRNEKTQRDNYNRGALPRPAYDQAVQQLQSAQAQVDAAQARLNSAHLQVGFTELRAEAAGTVIAKGAEPGEVVRAGQPIVQIARAGRKDALFMVPPRLMYMQGGSQSLPVEVSVTDNPNIRVTGFIREVGVQADPITRAIPVRITLPNAPDEMRIGATVTGGITLSSPAMMEIPSSALTESRGDPALWVVHPTTQEVQLRRVQVARYNPGSVIISSGLQNGEKVVTAGVQTLRPGQRVKLLDGSK